ncbi:hypothetical protein EDB80DRAFT_879054 [Ilyonectria destructans]|nr:hypothetical protein EDB80DRAFT_879054 [Ilyonectria destructans]
MSSYASNPGPAAKATRAKYACRECYYRRVRCNVNEVRPCSNCKESDAKYDILPSQRGRYMRKLRLQTVVATSVSRSPSLASNCGAQAVASTSGLLAERSNPQTGFVQASTQASYNTSVSGTVFFGDSNLLTLVPEALQHGDEQGADTGGSQMSWFLFPIPRTPQTQGDGLFLASISHLSAGSAQYLRDEGALSVPDLQSCLPVLQVYLTGFHPCFPVLDRTEIARCLSEMNISPILLPGRVYRQALTRDRRGYITQPGGEERGAK